MCKAPTAVVVAALGVDYRQRATKSRPTSRRSRSLCRNVQESGLKLRRLATRHWP